MQVDSGSVNEMAFNLTLIFSSYFFILIGDSFKYWWLTVGSTGNLKFTESGNDAWPTHECTRN